MGEIPSNTLNASTTVKDKDISDTMQSKANLKL